jgi:osmotically-inducible protein OsmY
VPGFLIEKKHGKCNKMIFSLQYKKGVASLLNMFNNLVVLFFAILMAGLSSCSTITGQEMSAREPIRETNTADTDENVDNAITVRVIEAIYKESSLKDEGIGVETHQRTVRLRGAVSSILVMEKAVEVARGVEGVRGVKDEMQFRWQY